MIRNNRKASTIVSAILLSVCGSTATVCGEEPQPKPAKPLPGVTKLVLLGTGTPNADPDRWGPAVAVVVNDTPYLVDCGPGVVRRAAAAFRNGVTALEPPRLARLFVTHLHSDHTLGYPDLIFSPWVLGRVQPLQVFGPPGIQSMTDHLSKAYEQDIQIRLDGLEPANFDGYKVNVSEIRTGMVYEDENVKVFAFPAKHGTWKRAFGFRFETPDKTIVISGDTSANPALIEAAKGCDILLHEVYSHERFQDRPPAWQQYHNKFHTSTRELAMIAGIAKPKLLVLYHQLFWGASGADLVSEIRRTYEGKVVSGNDLDVF